MLQRMKEMTEKLRVDKTVKQRQEKALERELQARVGVETDRRIADEKEAKKMEMSKIFDLDQVYEARQKQLRAEKAKETSKRIAEENRKKKEKLVPANQNVQKESPTPKGVNLISRVSTGLFSPEKFKAARDLLNRETP